MPGGGAAHLPLGLELVAATNGGLAVDEVAGQQQRARRQARQHRAREQPARQARVG